MRAALGEGYDLPPYRYFVKSSTNVPGQTTERQGEQPRMSPSFYLEQESLCSSLLCPSTASKGKHNLASSWKPGAYLLLSYSISGSLITTLHGVITVVLKVSQLGLGRLASR